MVSIDEAEYSKLYDSFEREYKRVEVYKRRALTKNENLKIEYRECLVRTYNNILSFFDPIAESLPLEDKIDAQNRIVANLRRLKECFQILNLEYNFDKNIHAHIDTHNITETLGAFGGERNSDSESEHSDDSNSSVIDTSKSDIQNTNRNRTKKDNNSKRHGQHQHSHHSREDSVSSENRDTTINMAQTPEKIMGLANSTINYRYNGDPLNLDSFIDGIELLIELCEEQNQRILLKFLMTRLEG